VKWLALLLMLALPASATVVVRQVDVLDIVSGPTTNPLGMAQSDPFRYRVTSVQGTSVLSYVGSTAVTGLLTDVRLGDVVGRATGTINNAAGGEFTFYLTPGALLDVGAYYEFRGYVYGATGVIGTVAWDPVTMGGAACSSCAAVVVVSGGSADGVGPVSNVTVGASNSWTAATGALVISSNNPPIGYGSTNEPAGTLWYTADGWLLSGTNDMAGSGSSGMATWTNTADGGEFGISNVGWFASARNTYLNTNDIPVGFFAGGGYRNRFGALLFAPGYSNFEGSIFVGGYSNLYQHNAGRGLVAAGGISNTLNTADMTALALIGGANNYASGASSYAGLVGGQRETILATHSFVGGGQDGLMSGSHSGKFGRGTTNSSSAYGLNWGYLSALRSAPFGFAGGDRCEAQATGAIALGSRARPSHNWAFVWAGLGPGVVGSSATNQWVFGNISGGFGIGTTSPVPGGLSVAGAFGHANGGRAVLTGGVCIITLPVAMPDANYRIQLTYATDPTLLTPLGATGTASAIYVWGSGSNPFYWEAQDNQ
jgi:hypothetical protein